MDPILEGDKIFTSIAESVDWTETQSLEKASHLLNKLKDETTGLVIVDFLDSGNWDCIAGVEFDIENGFLRIHWHDYRNVTVSDEERKIRMVASPASLYSLLIKFKELRIVTTKKFPVFLLRGYALKDKEIIKYLKDKSSEFKLLDNEDNFSKLAERKINEVYETYTCLNTPIFSIIIIPKNSGISAFSSKKALLTYNLADSLFRLNKVKDDLDYEDLIDEDIICEKANSVRRIFEYVLKVELCYRYRQVNTKKDYSDLMLGDLINLIKPYREDSFKYILTQITARANELSHDSGKPVTKEKALTIIYMTILYTELLKSDISLFPYPDREN